MRADKIDRSQHRAERVLAQIASHKYSAHPRTYELLYRYAAGTTPALKRAVDGILERKDKLDPTDIDELAGEFISSRTVAEQSCEIAGFLSAELRQLLSTFELAQIETSGRAQKLSELAQTPTAADNEQLRALLETLIVGTREMKESNKQLESELSASMAEIKHLKASLEKARADSLIDPLTLLKNRKSFDDSLTLVLRSALPARTPVSLLMVDIDHFKRINDSFGHLIGDQVIRMIANVLKSLLGEQTPLARYGGEEFVALLSGYKLEAAIKRAEEVRRQVAERPFKLRSTNEMIGRLSISIGVSALRSADSAVSFIERADKCLYFAKKNGRNRIASEHDLEAAA